MNVVKQATLRAFWEKHRDAEEPLKSWYKTAGKARWRSLVEVRRVYPHADLVGRCTVFNIKGNDYRLVTSITYTGQAIYIKHVLAHKEYDKGGWKNDCIR